MSKEFELMNEVEKALDDINLGKEVKTITKSVMSPVKSILDELREDYLDTFETNRDLFSSIGSYKAYVHIKTDLEQLLDYFKQNEAVLESWDITIMENYIDFMLAIVKPRVKRLDSKIKELKEENE